MQPTVDRKYETQHRGSRRVYYRYHLELAHLPSSGTTVPFEIPATIEVEKGIYDRATPNGHVTLMIGAGRFGFPWLRSVRPVGWQENGSSWNGQ